MKLRTPAVAGVFYPHDPGELAERVDRLLDEGAERLRALPGSAVGVSGQTVGSESEEWTALIAPHAGYDYSGPIAGTAFATLREQRDPFDRVVVVGPAHWVGFRGIAVPGAGGFSTPLGDVPIAGAVVERLLRLPGVAVHDAAHAPEHALEVELPFLQRVLGSFELVPWITGDVDEETAATALAESLEGAQLALVVVSSDLSHYLDAAAARRADAETARDVEAGRPVRGVQACGASSINALHALLRRSAGPDRRLRTLDLRNSSDTAGTPDRVVGYGAFRLEGAGALRGRAR